MPAYYQEPSRGFELFRDAAVPGWRSPQRGALGALLGHWAVHHGKPALVAVPTGSGKTAIALAAPYIVESNRTLVVVPSTQLRDQTVTAFADQEVLRQIGALAGQGNPKVLEVKGRLSSWHDCDDVDVVVALPQSISPDHYDEDSKPPADLFDLVIVDEAHHAPARTWRAILDHFDGARKVLLTATPRRRDGKRVPGEVVFHYPLRAAMSDGYYKAVEARLLRVGASGQRREYDELIRDEILAEINRPEHASSTLLVRAGTRSRVAELVALYGEAGLEVVALTSGLGDARRTEILNGLKNGTIRAVAVVGMLGEGFDLPRLRLAAYHDKHKSVASTIQLIGRLVRSHPDFPQPSVLVTVQDADVYPGLRGALWELYQEDADWPSLLPGIIDDAVAAEAADKAFAKQLARSPAELSLESLRPLVRATVFEVDDDWAPLFLDGNVPAGLASGDVIRGRQVLYSTVTPENRTLLLVTQGTRSPRWNFDSGLDAPEYALHLITYLQPKGASRRAMLLVNSTDGTIIPGVTEVLDATSEHLRAADPGRLQRAFDTLPRLSVSNVGVRNTYGGGRGSATYKTFAGSGVDRGMREADTAQAAIGHAMAQVGQGAGNAAYNTGIAVEKAKMWESRYVPLREYDGALMDFADRYWSSAQIVAPLLPAVARGVRFDNFPEAPVAAIEMHHLLLASEWTTLDGFPIGRLDLQHESTDASGQQLTFTAVRPDTGATVWAGHLDTQGNVVNADSPVSVRRGHQTPRPFDDLLSVMPPTVYFLNGQIVSGATLYQPPTVQRDLTRWNPAFLDWSATNIEKETDRSAKVGASIHQTLKTYLTTRTTTARRRWVIENDGSGEIADLIVLEIRGAYEVSIELWHAKPASGANTSVRVTDMEVVVAQAIKSRRWLTERELWQEMADRYSGLSSPALKLIDGSECLLRAFLGLVPGHPGWSLTNRPFQLRGTVVIAQPGLSWNQLKAGVEQNQLSAIQIRDLLAVFDDSLGTLGESALVCSQ
ncbi:type III restriction enzyme res subunit [Mycobacteroides abscessus subsp. massiliense]|uniref:DEAD/DEAH box helicase family protein n=1 Tax=Mycobacteroides abscessus TaxID=36809 RepID=UPI0003164D08|nr:DEAD/DEAH box helicase family protein [Mycobacteroides abscessus]MBN7384528.1 DEAD/DEAH box helicase family protein [Mycobacteroides abscessus subsp. abscessus]MBN7415304.1 DEAD/DEAH box helicase family protein [Mycobacteroides abscessus subsp. abscessus]SKH36407.1 type III restriction enzyme res subunit [Mycobacteroides abscessus subsp. bolletii]SKU98399.1 type III restriction enzyme res subunit [Mycobacteroides abscessus subsp. bolletii]SLE45356.1 type III restriction enzyme res subunit [